MKIEIVLIYIDVKIYIFGTNNNIGYILIKWLLFRFMSNKTPIFVKTWEINSVPIHIEHYESEVIVRDENGNSMIIPKKNKKSIVINLNRSHKIY